MTWGRGWGLALILALPAGELWADSLRDAYSAFEKGQFEEAAQGFEAHTKKDPQDYSQLYNTGVALFQKGDFDKAIPYFDRAAQSPDPGLKSRAHYNKGVVYGQQQNWEQAEAAFQEALSYDNDNRVIQENLQFAREQKKKQKPEQQDQNQKQAQNDPQKKNETDQNQTQNDPQKNNESDQQQAQNDSQQKNESQKPEAGQNQDAEKKAGEEKLADARKDSAAEQKGQSQKQEPQQNAQQGGSDQRDKQESLAQGAKGAGDPTANGKSPDEQRVLTVKDLKKQEAEKLLRSVDDRIGSYILTPEQANTEGKSRNGKDW
ncbi:tetratricopeptide repeat protein [Oligoflexus tunisiensis]|uniref:tetratricopeptide repeat protein n=1 Tax=Oligoflexus tunisiensis TaxID=708132 RepID=UPI00159F1D9B|nr:tetratricopeptide repeat protein [Oligoflexus tunisiensis]